jgi:rod shape-determining protein MreD
MGHSEPRRLEERFAREVVLALVLLACAMVQTTLFPRPLGFPPNLILMLAVCQALIAGPSNGARWAFYGGLALDLCSASPIGLHALALLAAVLIASLPLRRMSQDNWLLPLIGTFFGALGYYIVLAICMSLVVAPLNPRAFVLVAVLPDTLITLIPALPLFLTWRWWNSRRRGEVPVDIY